MKVVVVGAGFGGLSAAALLSSKGYDVTLIEKNKGIGGRGRKYVSKGYQFDMGPSWYLMPEVFEDFFKEFGKKSSDYYTLKKIDPSYRIFFDYDDIVDVHNDLKKTKKLFDTLEENGGKKLEKYLDLAKIKYDAAMGGAIYKDYGSLFEMLDPKMFTVGRKMGIFGNLDDLVNKYFISDKAKKILEYSIGFLGGSPKITPATYQLMSYVDLIGGVYFPKGGMFRIAESIYEIAKENKSKFYLGEEVIKIKGEKGKAKQVITNKRKIDADVVIVNADYPYSELKLLSKENRTYDKNYWESRMMAPSAFVAYVGINKKLKKFEHHTLFLDKDWAQGFDEIFESKKAKWPTNPSYYLNIPSKTNPEMAPKGCETLFILVPLAPGLKDTKELREKFFKQIIADLEKRAGEKIVPYIKTKRLFAVNDYANDYNAYKGTALSIVHTLMQTAYFRPHHKSKKLSNLFYVGQYTHPGIGVPMSIISSQVVSDIIEKKFKKKG
jgi:1-hydroxy-2-isopentenylcarotenoid 3,4-desaturase